MRTVVKYRELHEVSALKTTGASGIIQSLSKWLAELLAGSLTPGRHALQDLQRGCLWH